MLSPTIEEIGMADFYIPSPGDVFQFPSISGNKKMTVVGEAVVSTRHPSGLRVFFSAQNVDGGAGAGEWINHSEEDKFFVWFPKSAQGDGLW